MNNITFEQYIKEVEGTAYLVAFEAMDNSDNDREAAMEYIYDSGLHEVIDSHEWVIYCAYSLDIIQHTGNQDYMVDNFGEEAAGTALKEGGLDGLHQAIAFWAFYEDVNEQIEGQLDEIEKALEENSGE